MINVNILKFFSLRLCLSVSLRLIFLHCFWVLFLFTFSFLLHADDSDDLLQNLFAEGITIDLREPTFCDGVFSTEKGGVILGPNLRIQARHLTYTRKLVEKQPVFTIEAYEDLIVEYGGYIFVGELLEYDFQNKTGIIYNGRTGLEPWFAGGTAIQLLADGTYVIEQGYITTDEHDHPDWKITAGSALLREQRFLEAKDVRFRFANTTVFWMPSLKLDLDAIFDSPISYYFRWGGKLGPRAGLIYEVLDWNNWKAFLRFDYSLNRGPGGGIETHYRSPCRDEYFHTINYIARDSSLFNPNETTRYRFEGVYHRLFNNRTSVDFTYDKLSDKDMASDYNDIGLELDLSERTELDIHHFDVNWIADFNTRVRINPFETLKQELPTLMWNFRPFSLGKTGLVSDGQYKVAYLDFVYSNHLPHSEDFHSARLAFSQRVYRPFQVGALTLTPELSAQSIFYGNSPHDNDQWLLLGVAGCEANAAFHRFYGPQKHVVEPYASYHYYSTPTVSPHHHFIFDIEDGWVRLNMLRFGMRNSLFAKNARGDVGRNLFTDLYANAFFDTDHIPQTVPKIYSTVIWKASDFMRYGVDTAWDFEENQLDHVNVRIDWTASADFAFAVEYRHRDAFDWRKADHDNFMLDAFHSVKRLRHSAVSDRRDTLLLHAYYNFYPNWALEYTSRHGWNRRTEPSYNEFELDLNTTVYSAGQLTLSYQHREGEDRLVISFSIGLKRPDGSPLDLIPCLEW